MISLKNELLATLERIKSQPILVVGDIMLDRYIWGQVERISPEAPVPVVEVKREEVRLGGAGNVVRNLSNLGVKVSLCGFIGEDDAGKQIIKLLSQEKVDIQGLITDKNRTTTVKTRVLAGRYQQQVLRIDREKTTIPESNIRDKFVDIIKSQLKDHSAVIISDYGKGAIFSELFTTFQSIDTKNADISTPIVLDPHPRNYDIYKNITVVKPNRKEAEKAAGIAIEDQDSALKAAKLLKDKWNPEMVLITLGGDGLVISTRKEQIIRDTHARSVFDVSGAGDTVTSVFTAALSVGATPTVAGDLANMAAGIVVGEIGTAAITYTKLKDSIEKYGA